MAQAATQTAREGAPGDRPLTAQQRADWDDNGHLILPGFFGADIIDPVNELIVALSDPQGTKPDYSDRVIVDLLNGAGASQRMRLADAPAEFFRRPVKFNDLFLETDVVRACNMHPRLTAILDALLDGAPAVCNSLNFIQGSEQTAHIDSWFMPPPVLHKMVVTSVCLEDVQTDAGPLFYYPGSHKIPPYRFSNGKMRAIPAEMPQCHDFVVGEIAQRGLKRETFIGRKGDVFIWASQLAHGGTPIANPASTRRSLVTHYWRAQDMWRHKLKRWGEGYYFDRDHQPVPADPPLERLAARARLELRWGLRLLAGGRS